MTPDRVVVIWRSLLLPGSETFIRNQADALTRWRPAFLGALKFDSVHRPGHRRHRVSELGGGPAGVPAAPLDRRVGAGAASAGGLRPAVVHAHFGGDGWLISRSAARLGAPLVITLHGQDVTRQAEAPGVRGLRYRHNLRTAFDRAALVIAVSEHIRQQAIALGADPAKVRVHHTGVPAPTVPMSAGRSGTSCSSAVSWRRRASTTSSRRSAWCRRAGRCSSAAGPLEGSIRARAAALRLDATFLGAQEPAVVSRSMAASKIFVSPSKTASNGDSEGLPTTILEAARLGVPVVSTYHSGIPEAVTHGETGLLVAEGDRVALAESIRRLLADDVLRARLGDQARLTRTRTSTSTRRPGCWRTCTRAWPRPAARWFRYLGSRASVLDRGSGPPWAVVAGRARPVRARVARRGDSYGYELAQSLSQRGSA